MEAKILLTGSTGFAGKFILKRLKQLNVNCYSLKSKFDDVESLRRELYTFEPDYIIHLGAQSFVSHHDQAELYRSNTVGTVNLLEAAASLPKGTVKRIILASSASVYGIPETTPIDETERLSPISHYGCSKLSMEQLSENFDKYFGIVKLRLFNFTGVGHNKNFLVPKLVDAYKLKLNKIEIGNLDVIRELNDVRDITNLILDITLNSNFTGTFNACSGVGVSMRDLISYLETKTNHKIEFIKNESNTRQFDIPKVVGSNIKQKAVLPDFYFKYDYKQTVNWMLNSL